MNDIAKRQALVSSVVAVTIVVLVCSTVVLLLSPSANAIQYAAASAVIMLALIPLYRHVWNHKLARHFSVRDWLRSFAQSVIGVAGLYLIDIFIGMASHPELPYYLAAMKNPAFVATVFVSPLVISTLVGTIRALILRALMTRPSAHSGT